MIIPTPTVPSDLWPESAAPINSSTQLLSTRSKNPATSKNWCNNSGARQRTSWVFEIDLRIKHEIRAAKILTINCKQSSNCFHDMVVPKWVLLGLTLYVFIRPPGVQRRKKCKIFHQTDFPTKLGEILFNVEWWKPFLFLYCGRRLTSSIDSTCGRSMDREKKNVSRWIFFEIGRWWCVDWESRSSKSGY